MHSAISMRANSGLDRVASVLVDQKSYVLGPSRLIVLQAEATSVGDELVFFKHPSG